MTRIEDTAPAPQVLPDTHLTICLHCGYSLRGLPAGNNCPECGHLPDRQAERQAVLDVIHQPMLNLGWRMLQSWKLLPAGWWWVLDQPQDRREARRRTWKWILLSWFLLLVLSCPIVMVNRIVTIIKYEHPPGEPEKKQVRGKGSSSGTMTSVSVYVTPSMPGGVLVTERTEEVVVGFQVSWLLRLAVFAVVLIFLTWLMMRWVWLPICLAAGPRKKSAAELQTIKTIALYQFAPMLILLIVEMSLLWINWALHTSGVVQNSFGLCLAAICLLHFGLVGTTWVAAIRSDRTGQIFERRLLPIAGIVLAAGPGGLLAIVLIGTLVTSLIP